jgi:hypothetical protein
MCARRFAEHLILVRRMGPKCKGSQADFQRFAGVSRLKTTHKSEGICVRMIFDGGWKGADPRAG